MFGRHPEFDDPKYWQFSRSSGLPRDYFKKRSVFNIDVAMIVVAALFSLVTFFVLM